jgi:hypothetical protein
MVRIDIGNVATTQPHPTGLMILETGQTPQKGRLATSARTHDSENLSPLYAQVHVHKDVAPSLILFGETADFEKTHGSLLLYEYESVGNSTDFETKEKAGRLRPAQ